METGQFLGAVLIEHQSAVGFLASNGSEYSVTSKHIETYWFFLDYHVIHVWGMPHFRANPHSDAIIMASIQPFAEEQDSQPFTLYP